MDTLAEADPDVVTEILSCDERKQLSSNLFHQLQTAESKAIEVFLNESENLVALSDAVGQCDDILCSLENVLCKFDATLDAASAEILLYQQRSSALFDELDDKRELRNQLHTFIETLVLTPQLIREVSNASVNGEPFAMALGELERKLNFVNGSEHVRNSVAYGDVSIEMERLRLTAVKRGRDFLLEKIHELRQRGSNIQAQQNALVKHCHLIQFLKEHAVNTYDELRTEYCLSVGSKFTDVFKGYWASLEGLETSEEGVLLGSTSEQSSYYSYFESFFDANDGSNVVEDSRESFFELKDRLTESSKRIHELPLMPTANLRGKVRFESIFASISRLLVDTAAHEYLFCKNFWHSEGWVVFRDAFKPILDFVHGSLNASLQEQNDIIALLLCISINRQNFLVMTKRRNPALDDYFDAVNLLLWPRVKFVMDQHLRSVIELGSTQERKYLKDEILPLTRRYAAMMASVLVTVEFITDGNISLNIEQLRYAVLNHLLVVSRKFSKHGEGTVFLLHNLNHVIEVLKKSRRTQEGFEEAFSRALELYVDSKLQPWLNEPRKMGHETVKVIQDEIRADFAGPGGASSLADIVEKTCMSSLCTRWGDFLAGLEADIDRDSLVSTADLLRGCIRDDETEM